MSRRAHSIQAFVFVLLICSRSYAPPKDPQDYLYPPVSTTLRVVPHGAYLEGSLQFGGTQPDYIIDTDAPEFARLFRYADRLKKEPLLLWEKIDRISKYVRRTLPLRDYSAKPYVKLNKEFKRSGEPVPFSEYVKCKAGVCREYSLITHLLLERAGIKNQHGYAKIRRASRGDKYDITEDHGFTVVHVRGEDWVVDPYYWGFHGFLLNDLLSSEGITEKSKSAPFATPGPGFRRIIHLHRFPRVWAPRCPSLFQQLNRI